MIWYVEKEHDNDGDSIHDQEGDPDLSYDLTPIDISI